MGSEDHVAGSVGDAVVGVGCTVVKELVDFCVGAFSGSGLFCAEFA